MKCCNLNMYTPDMTTTISYSQILDLPVKYPEYVIQRPLANEYLFYHVPGKKFYNYNKFDDV